MRQADEQRDRRSKGRSRSAGQTTKAGTSFWTFHPNKEQREELKSGSWSCDETVLVLAKAVERGIKFTLGYSLDRGSVFVTGRDGAANWDEGTTLSVWHSDLAECLKGMAYVLTSVYPDYPEFGPGPATTIDEW